MTIPKKQRRPRKNYFDRLPAGTLLHFDDTGHFEHDGLLWIKGPYERDSIQAPPAEIYDWLALNGFVITDDERDVHPGKVRTVACPPNGRVLFMLRWLSQ